MKVRRVVVAALVISQGWGCGGKSIDLLVREADAIVVGRIQEVQVVCQRSGKASQKQEESATQPLDERLTPRDVASRAYLDVFADLSSSPRRLGGVWLGFKAEDGCASCMDVEHEAGQMGIWLLRWLPRYQIYSAAYDPGAFVSCEDPTVIIPGWKRSEETLASGDFSWIGHEPVRDSPPEDRPRAFSARTWHTAPAGVVKILDSPRRGAGALWASGQAAREAEREGLTSVVVVAVNGPEGPVPAVLPVRGRLVTWEREATHEAVSWLSLDMPQWPEVSRGGLKGPLVRRTAAITLPGLPAHRVMVTIMRRTETLATTIRFPPGWHQRVELGEADPVK